MVSNAPLGQDPRTDPYKTGQRVPMDGDWEDQYGVVSHHDAHTTFPPCIGRNGECALRRLVVK